MKVYSDCHLFTWPSQLDCTIHRLNLCSEVRPTPNKCPEYDTKQSDGEALLPSLPGPLCPGVLAPNRVLSMGQIELNCVLRLN